ncbi:cytochrome c [Rhodoblastus acidophilus]|uniref:Cytochrome c n=1 Tax=Candidatus Rhodoblastus alkanivorans TaxID=2954117 RepID=A0ABS9Z7B6_9HYPH|nr:cytochrome c [Candidatus Rhodoblastus alkanivorans]MCI4677716.1 cytochrome c [Candidatus Rhodoblastus alkanivorans]MCI4682552.1 cytochrome c [Candidatus Rhodoblastus alkanivorans]MDI4639858.1 cytochrome c [Rhodoblastus acidophilus]
MTKQKCPWNGSCRAALVALLALAAGVPAHAQGVGGRELTVGKGSMVATCAACHGVDGIAHDAEVPNLAGQNEAYLYNQLRAFHSRRRAHKEMTYMSRNLTDEEMRALAAYFAHLPPR